MSCGPGRSQAVSRYFYCLQRSQVFATLMAHRGTRLGVAVMEPADEALARLNDIARELAGIGFVLPGTVTERYTRCTSPNCRCRAEPPRPHGPYLDWTRKVAGKTVTRRLSREQYERYRPWFENHKRLRELSGELAQISLKAAETAEGWKSDKPATSKLNGDR